MRSFCSTACRKKPPSITVIKSLFICTGTRPAGFPVDIPDEQEKDLGYRDVPSWRRICKTLLKNDFWCRMLSFSPTQPKHYERYCRLVSNKRKEWRTL